LTTITSFAGTRTATDTLSGDDMLYLVTAIYATGNGPALDVTSGSDVEIVFRNGGSVFNTSDIGAAVRSSVDLRLTIEDGSTLSSGLRAINMQGHVLDLTNFGLIAGESVGIYGAGNGSTVTNYGEIRGTTAYYSLANTGSTINNFGTFAASSPAASALYLGDLNDTINNYGTIFGSTNLNAGSDKIFNGGTMRGDSAIVAINGDKTIVNSGLISFVTAGNYAISLASGNDTVTNLGRILGDVLLGDGANTFKSGEDGSVTGTVIGGSGHDLMYGGASADNFFGGGGSDTLFGNGGNDYLDGSLGNDYMKGGTGSDFYVVDDPLDVVVETKGEGVDTIYAYASYTLQAGVEVEYLTAGMANDLTLVGNELAQTMTDNVSNGTLDGGAGADVLIGGAGNDTYVLGAEATGVDTLTDSAGIDTITSTITRSLISYPDIENLTLLGSAAINGTGNAHANVLTGNAAANVLDGGVAGDEMHGLGGNDTYVVDNAADVVDETGLGSGGSDTVLSSITFSLADALHADGSIENLTLTGSAAINGTGNALNNVITGNSAANVLTGGLGTDTLVGGLGNDVYVLENGSDTVSDSGGIDTITSAITRSLASYPAIERLTLTGTAAINGTGNALANVLVGNTAANVLSGAAGNDVLYGALGNDTMGGGVGNDVFVFNTAPNASTNKDTITDFANASGNNDTIYLENAIFAKLTATGALNPAYFHVGASAADANDYIVYNQTTGALFYDSNGSTAGGAIQFATLTNKPVLTAGDFVVI
jgi:Ca2+-binding RTX toxin-like protein